MLNTQPVQGGVPRLEYYSPINSATLLPYVCEVDQSVIIAAAAGQGAAVSFGMALSFAAGDVAGLICKAGFDAFSGHVACAGESR